MTATYNTSDNSLRLYIDGDLVAEDTRSYSRPFTADSDLGMGAMYTDGEWKYHYTGLLDEVALYDRALTSNEVNQLFTKGSEKGSYCMLQTTKPEIVSEPIQGVKLGDTYLYNVVANGTPDPTYSLKIAPSGMTINDVTGEISWDPSTTGTYNVLVEAMNIAGNTTQPFTVKVVDPCITGMTTYFTFEEESGDITWDDANFIQGDLHNNPTWGPGISEGGLTFNGTDQYMTFSDDQNFYDWPAGNSFTFEFWCQSLENQNALQVMLSRGTLTNTNWWFSTHSSTGYATFFLYDEGRNGGGIVGTTNINDGEWHHIVGIRDAAAGYNILYVDGKLEADSAFTYSSSFSSTTLVQVANFLENGSHKYYFDGTLDEIAVYDRVLGPAEVTEHYTKGFNNFGYCSNVTIEPKIISKPVTNCYVNQEYTYQVEALGVPAPTFNLTGAPSGLSINTFTGKISGKPTIPGEYSMSVTASGIGSDVQKFTLEVLASCIGNTSFYFDFEEADGDIVYDVFSPREGHLINSPERGEGLVGNTIQFNGNDQRIFIPKEEEYNWSGSESFTIELWCLPGAVPELLQVMIGRDVPGSTHWWLGTSSNTGSGEGIPVFYLFDAAREGSGVIGNSTIHDGNWHHLAAVREGNTGHTMLYVDGELQADSSRIYTNDFAADVNIQVANIYIDYQNKYFYEGKLDEIAIYKAALSADEIRGHYRYGLTGSRLLRCSPIRPLHYS